MERTLEQVGMTWEEVCADASLADLPYKIELNEWGQILMSPTRLKHGAYQSDIDALLRRLHGHGRIVQECAVRTGKGTRVADVAWLSQERWAQVQDEFDASIAPEICIEVLSPRNAAEEIRMKRQLYFQAGALEVWICGENGDVQFFGPEGRLEHSRPVSAFPGRLEI